MAGRGTDIILGGNAEMLAKAEMILARKDPNAPENEQEALDALIELPRSAARSSATEEVIARAASRSSAPSATSRAASTTSSAVARAGRAIRERAASTSRSKTT